MQKAAQTNGIERGVRYYYKLQPKRERNAQRLDEWFRQAERVFRFEKEKR